MIYPIPKNEEETKEFARQAYEAEKEDLIACHRQMGFPKETLKDFIVNSLKGMGYDEELKEDGLL